jgi:hypothetical protein
MRATDKYSPRVRVSIWGGAVLVSIGIYASLFSLASSAL